MRLLFDQDLSHRLGTTSRADARPDHPIRLITIKTTPHVKRGKYKGGSTGAGSDGVLRIATNLLDVPPEIIALIYRYRWTIEIFFRFFNRFPQSASRALLPIAFLPLMLFPAEPRSLTTAIIVPNGIGPFPLISRVVGTLISEMSL